MKKEYLDYFRALFEGTADVSWNAWFSRHEGQLQEELPRAEFLRLKFNKIDEAGKYLREAGIDFAVSPLIHREKYYSLLHESVLDENGRPTEEFERKCYDGAKGLYLDGEFTAAGATLDRYRKKVLRKKKDERITLINDMCFDGEMEFEFGNHGFGQMLLEQVLRFPDSDDQIIHAKNSARKILEKRV